MDDIAKQLSEALKDRYAIEREIGSGGMANVYLAEDLKHKRKVAIKVLRPELAAVLGGERFLHEIRVTANLQHPHILPLHDSGRVAETQSGGGREFLYYVMPYVEGESLRDKLNREKQLPIDDAVSIATEVADALGSAHRQGVVHRDMKPENILLREGHALVADFGIALAVTSAGGDRLTETGLSLGTPAYMSPEQVAGERDIDARSDIYSLACVLYEMLAGDPPFVASNPRAVLAKHITDPPPPISTVRSSVPSPVAATITRGLGKAPADRHTSVGEFARALTADEAGPAKPIEASVAVLPLENLMGDPEQEFFVDGMTEALIANLAKVGSIKVISRTSVMQYKGTRKPLPEIAEELNVGAIVEGSVMRAANQVRVTAQLIDAASDRHLWAESYDGTLDDIFALQSKVAGAIAKEIRTALTPEEEGRLAPAREVDLEAHELYLKGRQCHFTWEQEGFNRAIRYFEQAIARDAYWGLPHAALAESYWLLSFVGTDPPSEHRCNMKSAAERAVELDGSLGDPQAILAQVRVIEDYDWARAGFEFTRAIELSPESYSPHMLYGSFYLNALGAHDLAAAEVRFCLELDPLNIGAAVELAWVHFVGREFDESIHELQMILEMDPNYPMAVGLLGLAFVQVSAFDDAIEVLERASSLSQRAPFFLALLAIGYAAAGRRQNAKEILDDLGAKWPHTYTTPYYLAAAYVALQQNEVALEWLERAYEVRDPWLVFANEDPVLDPLRSEPSFQDLMRRMGFTEIRQ